jgi:hypothetical protein
MTDDSDRPIYVERAAADDAGYDAVFVRRGDVDDVLAVRVGGNALREGWPIDAAWPGRWVVGWSGSMADDLFEAHPYTWLSAGHETLASRCAEIESRLASIDRRLVLQPHHRHVLSDAPSSRSFLESRDGGSIGVALAPASMLTPDMAADAAEHLERMFQMLGDRCAMVMLAHADELESYADLIDRYVQAETPVIVGSR